MEKNEFKNYFVEEVLPEYVEDFYLDGDEILKVRQANAEEVELMGYKTTTIKMQFDFSLMHEALQELAYENNVEFPGDELTEFYMEVIKKYAELECKLNNCTYILDYNYNIKYFPR